MKTTVEVSDELLRRAKAQAAAKGITLAQFFREALELRLREARRPSGRPAWRKLSGALRSLRGETAKVQKTIEREFEQVDAEDE